VDRGGCVTALVCTGDGIHNLSPPSPTGGADAQSAPLLYPEEQRDMTYTPVIAISARGAGL
jgi:hypothetical protein